MFGNKHILSWKMMVLKLLLPLNFLVLIFVLFVQIWYLQSDVEQNGLKAKRYIAPAILELLSDKPNEEKEIPSWINTVVLEDGRILYPFLDDSWKDKNPLEVDAFLALNYIIFHMKQVRGEIMTVAFSYNHLMGICMYDQNLLPPPFRILQNPRYQINLFLGVTLIFLLGAMIVHNLQKDILELIKASERLRNMDFDSPIKSRKENELQPVFIALEKMRKELNSSRKQGVQWIMSLTHDLKTPLTSIRGYLEAFRDGVIDSPEEGKPIVNILLGKAALLGERIDEMLDFSQIVNAKINDHNVLFSVQSLLESLVSYFSEEALLYNRCFTHYIVCPESLQIMGSEKQLNRAIINLFDNAVRHTGEESSIRFSVLYSRNMNSIILRMDDDGDGVPPEERTRIFDLFYKSDHGRNTRGMGIGLSSVKLVSEMHGGNVSCRESDLGGACFEFILPVVPEGLE